jgi:hypothetical protein
MLAAHLGIYIEVCVILCVSHGFGCRSVSGFAVKYNPLWRDPAPTAIGRQQKLPLGSV